MCQFALVFMFFCIGKTLGKPNVPAPNYSAPSAIICSQRNISCIEVQTAKGYKFHFSCPAEGELNVIHNNSHIAVRQNGPQPFCLWDEVKSLEHDSVTTIQCRDLYIRCFVTTEDDLVSETCFDYKVTEKPEKPDEPDPTFYLIIGLVGLMMAVIILVFLVCWKKNQYFARKMAPFSMYLRSRLRILEREGTQVTRPPAGRGVQRNTAGDLDGKQLNGGISLLERAATGRDGSGERVNKQDETLESVHSPSIDCEADGKTASVSSLDHNLSCEVVQPTTNGNIHAPVLIKDCKHRAMNGSVRDDPGGMKDSNGKPFVRNEETHNGCAPGCGGPEACENEGHWLLPSQGADRQANQPSDMTDEARALVNKAGFESNQPRMCSTAPENGVKSTTNMENYQH
ncbi:hypothetical protein PBY51_007782 [Eleginops maclovinus]|uniref:Uncharacterized protein n=2 Tax=Eleginops maclovinus TaxID=56733 RepID=A0AAN8AB63_ELEMC|nr:hypothetical protein PBY51_007782 [Eleginops maclovinus]